MVNSVDFLGSTYHPMYYDDHGGFPYALVLHVCNRNSGKNKLKEKLFLQVYMKIKITQSTGRSCPETKVLLHLRLRMFISACKFDVLFRYQCHQIVVTDRTQYCFANTEKLVL